MECREIRIPLLPSRRLSGALGVLYLLAIATVVSSTLPAALIWSVAVVLVLDLARHWRAHMLANRHRTWLIRAHDSWRCERDGVRHPVVLDGASTVLGPVVVLILRGVQRRHVYLLARDAFTATDWRRLRVSLRLGAATPQPGVRIVSSASGARSG